MFTLTPIPKSNIGKYWTPLVLFFCISSLLIINGTFFTLPSLIMNNFRIALKQATISTDRTGCKLFKMKKYDISCPKKKIIHPIQNIDVLWRVGELFLRFKDKDGSLRYLTIPSNNIKIYDIDSS
jgi:hypothetical protein